MEEKAANKDVLVNQLPLIDWSLILWEIALNTCVRIIPSEKKDILGYLYVNAWESLVEGFP